MSDVLIRAEGLGKKYLIGHETEVSRDATLRDSLVNVARRMGRSASDLVQGRQLVVGDEVEEFWALKDVNFEIGRGEVVGIIGRNGAGKSTLLKILSRITEPTEGRVTIDGRVASLLEGGTGFHPELSGRENIFLNGSILGMTRREIQSKFDEIVDFAGVDKFIDTPVKRYSSGMKVRLGFSVAAHLEPEILIVDEVLAVGDAEFQKKCLGKMEDVAFGGRTVLFVSHNMGAVQSLCDRSILLHHGSKAADDETNVVIEQYLERNTSGFASNGAIVDVLRKGRGSLRFERLQFFSGTRDAPSSPMTGAVCDIVLTISGSANRIGMARLGISFKDALGHPLVLFANESSLPEALKVGNGSQLVCRIDKFPLTEGKYGLSLFLEIDGVVEDWIEDSITVEVAAGSFFGTNRNCPNGWEGKSVLVNHSWQVQETLKQKLVASE